MEIMAPLHSLAIHNVNISKIACNIWYTKQENVNISVFYFHNVDTNSIRLESANSLPV